MTDETHGAVNDDYIFVQLPDGSVRAVAKSDVVTASAVTEKQDAVPSAEAEPEKHYYVHLANGEVLRVAASDLPTSAGHDAQNGYWQRGNESHYVIGVYPVEASV